MSQIGPGSHVTLHYRLAVVAGGAERELFSTFATHPATLQNILGWVNAPFAWLMGVPTQDCVSIGQILGERVVLNAAASRT